MIPSRRALAGVAHDIAHHACSGLGYLNPHMAEALRAKGSDTTEVELLHLSPYPANAEELRPLRLALRAMREKAQAILVANGLGLDDVASIRLLATPAPWDSSGHCLHTRAIITSSDLKTYDSGWLA